MREPGAEEGPGLGGPGCSALTPLPTPCSPLSSLCDAVVVRKEQEIGIEGAELD